MSLLSPGVEVIEIDASTIAPTVSNSIACFAGDFDQGPVGVYMLITNEDDLVSYYGKPTKTNYNDWMQASTFLKYGNKLFVSRGANTNGSVEVSGITVTTDVNANSTIPVDDSSNIEIGDYVAFGNDAGPVLTPYVVVSKSATDIEVDRAVTIATADDANVYNFSQSMNAVFDAVEVGGTEVPAIDYVKTQIPILNYSDFETNEASIAMNSDESKVKFIAKNPGNWSNSIKIAIAKASDFNTGIEAFEGIYIDDLFEYYPTGSELGVIISINDTIKETFTVSFDETAKDSNNKSIYIEDVINTKSNYVFVKDNTSNTNDIKSYVYNMDATISAPITLVNGIDSPMGQDDLIEAYSVWDNKEEVDVDIVIGNELDSGLSAKGLVDIRKDCIAFIGANYSDCVGQKAAQVVNNLVNWRKTGSLNFNDMFVVVGANYVYQYNKYLDKYVWINVAGHIAGLRAQTSTNRASWWASAGLDRGQLKDVTKLAFNPDNGKRDILYKNGLNPIVSFAGQGIVMWGQKTLLSKPSSFDRVNVRGLFNTLERSLSKMAKYQVMEFNDTFTRNRIVSMVKPYLGSVKAGRGIQDFLVICDESNNTPDVISRNNLVVDIFIKPTYVAEFIQLRFTNAGTNSFSQVIGG